MRGSDRLSNLPDSLLTHILSFLATNESVRTSVLSKRWESLWLNVPGLELFHDDYPPYGESPPGAECFIDTYLDFNHNNGSRVQKFKVQYDETSDYREYFVNWIETVVERGVQHLEVESLMERSDRDYLTDKINNSDTLVSLKLANVGLSGLNPTVGVSLPCLKILHLADVSYDDEDPLFMEKLISGCPVLEEFALALPFDYHERQKNVSSLRVKSKTLKSFIFSFDTNYTDTVFAFEIDAPQLKYMYFSDHQSDSIVLKNLTSLSMIEIGSEFHVDRGSTSYTERRNAIRDFLNGISSVRHIVISKCTLKVLFNYSKLGRIRKFDNVTRLQAEIYSNMLELIPAFLESFPNLKNLILDLIVVTKEIKLSGAPQCMVLDLECVEIKLKEVTLDEPVKTLVRYFLENSVVLKKLILRFKESSEAMKVYAREKKASSRAKKASSRAKKVSDIFKELSTFTKLSPRCEIITIN